MHFSNHQSNKPSFENTKIFGPKQELDYNERHTPIFTKEIFKDGWS